MHNASSQILVMECIANLESLNSKIEEICQNVYLTPVSKIVHSSESIDVGGLLIAN